MIGLLYRRDQAAKPQNVQSSFTLLAQYRTRDGNKSKAYLPFKLHQARMYLVLVKPVDRLTAIPHFLCRIYQWLSWEKH